MLDKISFDVVKSSSAISCASVLVSTLDVEVTVVDSMLEVKIIVGSMLEVEVIVVECSINLSFGVEAVVMMLATSGSKFEDGKSVDFSVKKVVKFESS